MLPLSQRPSHRIFRFLQKLHIGNHAFSLNRQLPISNFSKSPQT